MQIGHGHLYLLKTSLMVVFFSKNTDVEYYKVFLEDFRKDPSLLTGDPLRILDNVINRQSAYVGVSIITQ